MYYAIFVNVLDVTVFAKVSKLWQRWFGSCAQLRVMVGEQTIFVKAKWLTDIIQRHSASKCGLQLPLLHNMSCQQAAAAMVLSTVTGTDLFS